MSDVPQLTVIGGDGSEREIDPEQRIRRRSRRVTCAHPSVIIECQEHVLICATCDRRVDPIDWLTKYYVVLPEGLERIRARREEIGRQIGETEAQLARLRGHLNRATLDARKALRAAADVVDRRRSTIRGTTKELEGYRAALASVVRMLRSADADGVVAMLESAPRTEDP